MISKSAWQYGIFIFVTIFSIIQFVITIHHLTIAFNKYKQNDDNKISVGYILGGNSWTRYWFLTNIKSILMHSKKGLDLHIVIDNDTKEDVEQMIRTWNLSEVDLTFYNLDTFLPQVEWIPTYHYSKKYALAKILLPSIIHKSINKIIYLDVDTIFRTDISYIWKELEKMNSSHSFGMVENLSDWYLNEDGRKRVWPAISRGFNTGVMLLNLKSLRKMNWKQVWRNATEKQLVAHGATQMADQDIFNAIIYENPTWVYSIDCGYNYQLGSKSNATNLCGSDPLIIHFNSKQKKIPEKYEQFEIVLETVEKQNSALLKAIRNGIQTKNPRFSPCGKYLPKTRFHLFPNVFGKPKWKKFKKIPCLVTQFTVDRIDHFIRGSKNWPFPISASFYGSDEELYKISKEVRNLNRTDIAIHHVFKPISHKVFPINFLRNFAIKNAHADTILLLDVDFIILGDLNEILSKASNMKNDQAFVLPAFEPIEQIYDYDKTKLPHTKAEMIESLKNKKARVFRSNIWPSAQKATNLEQWISSNQTYKVNWKKNYEPYIMIKKLDLPLYDERFGGFGWNKVTHIMSLKLKNFEFNVLSSSFVLHQSHSPSDDLLRFRNDAKFRRCLHYLKHQFILEASQLPFHKPSRELITED